MISLHGYFRKLRTRPAAAEPAKEQPLHDGCDELFSGLPPGSKELVDRILADRKIDAGEAVRLRELIFWNGKPGAEEIRLLFEIHDHVYGNSNDPTWEKLFLTETLAFFTAEREVRQKLSLTKAYILYDQVKKSMARTGWISEPEMALLKEVTAMTGGLNAMNFPGKQILPELFRDILQDERIDPDEIRMLRGMILQNTPPLDEDIEMLYEVNLTISDKPRDQFWEHFFAESVGLYVVPEPPAVSKNKLAWLEERLRRTEEKHRMLTPAEQELIGSLKERIGEVPPFLAYYLANDGPKPLA
jgi:hypothetical protein